VGVPQHRIVANVVELLEEVARCAPAAVVVVQSPTVPARPARRRPVAEPGLPGLVAARNPHCHLDVWPALADHDDVLARDNTDDDVDLTAAGYAAWLSVLGPDMRRRLSADGTIGAAACRVAQR
jgi:hypothetical protein